MQSVKAVIGAGFGNEGKGKVVNTYARDWADIVVRHSGGCQSTHTVEHRNGFTHVFSHLGAASVDNVPTYLSEYFVVNPSSFLKELDILSFRSDGLSISEVLVDSKCIITTPFDILINQLLELSRMHNRHGSRGMGINETIIRNKIVDVSLNVAELDSMNSKGLFNLLTRIRTYTINRLQKLSISIPDDLQYMFKSDEVLKTWIDEMFTFLENILILPDSTFLRLYDNILFEGSQGLLLDAGYKWFPHVTHARTGITNVLKIMQSVGAMERVINEKQMEVTYVTPPYMKRHGAGPFPSEVTILGEFDIVDETNRPNQFQGSLRIGYLDILLLRDAILNDTMLIPGTAFTKIHMTCMDHLLDVENFKYKDTTGSINTCSAESIPALFVGVANGFEFSNSPYSD